MFIILGPSEIIRFFNCLSSIFRRHHKYVGAGGFCWDTGKSSWWRLELRHVASTSDMSGFPELFFCVAAAVLFYSWNPCGGMTLLLGFCCGWAVAASSSAVGAANRNSTEMHVLDKQRVLSWAFKARGTGLISIGNVNRQRRDSAKCNFCGSVEELIPDAAALTTSLSRAQAWEKLGEIWKLSITDKMSHAVLSRVQLSSLLLPDAILTVCGILIPPFRIDIFIGFPSPGDFAVRVWWVHVAAFPLMPVGVLKVMFPAGMNSWLGSALLCWLPTPATPLTWFMSVLRYLFLSYLFVPVVSYQNILHWGEPSGPACFRQRAKALGSNIAVLFIHLVQIQVQDLSK